MIGDKYDFESMMTHLKRATGQEDIGKKFEVVWNKHMGEKRPAQIILEEGGMVWCRMLDDTDTHWFYPHEILKPVRVDHSASERARVGENECALPTSGTD